MPWKGMTLIGQVGPDKNYRIIFIRNPRMPIKIGIGIRVPPPPPICTRRVFRLAPPQAGRGGNKPRMNDERNGLPRSELCSATGARLGKKFSRVWGKRKFFAHSPFGRNFFVFTFISFEVI